MNKSKASLPDLISTRNLSVDSYFVARSPSRRTSADSSSSSRFPVSVLPEDMEQNIEVEVDSETAQYREELIKSAISLSETPFELEIGQDGEHSRRSSSVGFGGEIMSDNFDEDDMLAEMDSPARRFHLARQQALRKSAELSDDEGSVYDDDDFEVPAMNFVSMGGRPSLSLDVPGEASTFFDDDEYDDDDEDGGEGGYQDDDGLYEAYQQSRPGRFPRPNLSAVTERTTPGTGNDFDLQANSYPMPVRAPAGH